MTRILGTCDGQGAHDGFGPRFRFGGATSTLALALVLALVAGASPQAAKAAASADGAAGGAAGAASQAGPDAPADAAPSGGKRSTRDGAITDTGEIVVTGTLVRGIAPPGTNVISVGEAEVSATGASSTAQLLQTIPQLGSFNSLQFPVGLGNQVTSNRPNLRTLPGFNTAGGSTTLVLMDGHRLVGMGVNSTSPDPDVIPPGAIERVEVVPDGGSAIYGSDAVAGVLNFITRKRFDGVKLEGHYGFADDYYQMDVSGTAGTDWGSGSAYVSYTYSEHDALFGRDRDYMRQLPFETGTLAGYTNVQCAPGNVLVGSTFHRLPYSSASAAGAAGTPNQCDISDDASFYPAERRHSAMVSLVQELAPSVELDVKAFYADRRIDITSGPYRLDQNAGQRTTPATAGFAEHRVGAETSQTVYFQFGPNDAARQSISLKTWGITPTVTADLGGSWRLRVLGSYSHSDTENHQRNFNQIALNNAINAGLFNPYDPSLSNPAAVEAITNSELYARTRQSLADVRAIVDGELLTLPGGGVKVAAGVEYYRESYQTRTGNPIVPGTQDTGYGGLFLPNAANTMSVLIVPAMAPLPSIKLNRNVTSAFGELVVPVFGTDNATTLLQELTLSAAVRYDKYSDFGDTLNPRFGVTYRPFGWLKFRGSWGKSFNAPSLADNERTRLVDIAFAARFPPASLIGQEVPAPTTGQAALFVQGNAPDIKPQTAKTLSLGADFQPYFAPGLTLGVTYWKIDLKGVIGLPPTEASSIYGPYRNLVNFGPFTQAEIDALLATAGTIRGSCAPQPQCVYSVVDLRKRNLGEFKLDGLDFNASYTRDLGFGMLRLGANANYELNRKRQALPGQPFYDDIVVSEYKGFRLRSFAGLQVGGFQGRVTWNHTGGYKLPNPVGLVPQTRVGAFDVFDLFFEYDLNGSGLAKDLTFTLNVNNVFNQDPPEYRGDPAAGFYGIGNGNTLGRMIQLGVSKTF